MSPSRFPFTGAVACAVLALVASTACTTTTTTSSPAPIAPEDRGAAAETPSTAPTPDEATTETPTAGGNNPPSDGKCHPVSSKGMTTAPYAPPKGSDLGLCTDEMIASYIACQDGVASACAEIAGPGKSCKTCIESKESDPAWGPVVLGGIPALKINEAGCGALANDDIGTSGCGQGLANYTECLNYTCGEQCVGSDYGECATEARGTECKAIVDGLKTSCANSVSDCFAGTGDTAKTFATRIIKRFCGGPSRR